MYLYVCRQILDPFHRWPRASPIYCRNRESKMQREDSRHTFCGKRIERERVRALLHRMPQSRCSIFLVRQKFHLLNFNIYICMALFEHNQPTLTSFLEINSIRVCTFCLLYTSPSPRDRTRSRMPSSA